MNQRLLILGAGRCGQMAKEVAEAMECFPQIDFLDDQASGAVGKLLDYERFSTEYAYANPAMEIGIQRLKWIRKLEESCYKIPVLLHPRAYVSPSAQLMKGTIVEPMAVVQTNTTVAIGCLLSAGAVVEQNCFIGDGCHIGCNASVPAGTILPAQTKVICSCLYQPLSLQEDA